MTDSTTAIPLGQLVSTTKAVADPSPSPVLFGRLVSTFHLGRLEYGIIERTNGVRGTALLRNVEVVDEALL